MTLYWWAVVALSRFRCRVIGYHAWTIRESHGYRVIWCRTCYASEIKRCGI
jgi:hypothetical protein